MDSFRFRYFSLSKKLMGIVIFSWLLIAGLITSFFVGQDFYFFQSSRVANLAGLAGVISINLTASLDFADSDTATEILSSLSARPQIHQAAVYTRDNKLFARYVSPDEEADDAIFPEQFPYTSQEQGEDTFFFRERNLELFVPIHMDGQVLGTLLIRENLSDFNEKLVRTAFVVGAIMATALFFAWIVSSMLQRYISSPILAMAETMRRVRNEKQYSVRISNEFTDELGILADGFNSMLGHIQQRDQQLLDSKQSAEEASLAKSTFLAQMSHEIRTPMNGVLGIASLLSSTALDEKQAQYVRTISNSGEALLLVINDILDFSKIEAGKLELENIPFSLHNIAEEAVDLFSEHARRKGLRMGCWIDPCVPPYVMGDPGRLRQVLMNLLGNGVKFTSRGQVDLTVGLAHGKEDEASLVFKVTDSGIGIRKDKLSKIFSAFSQADESTTRKFGGTGLGLVICEQLVRLQGGKIGVESEENKGSAFWFTVDYKIAKDFDPVSSSTSNYSGKHRENYLKSNDFIFFDAHVLVAEDNPTNQIVTRGMLEKLGCTVDVVENGREAVDAALQNTYDLIFMDCHMPHLDGYEASEKIRQNGALCGAKHIPIIALTAHAMKGDQEQCLAAGMDDYLSKPCSEGLIGAVLEKWLPVKTIKKLEDQVLPKQSITKVEVTAPTIPMRTGNKTGSSEDKPKYGMHVLVVEDDTINQDVAVGMLQSFGCTVQFVCNGQKAVEAAAKETYDLIFMDCQMPVMDGYEATTAIRGMEESNKPKERTPIIAMTGNVLGGDRKKCFSAGMDDYIGKPFRLDDFKEILERWFSGTAEYIEEGIGAPVE